MDMNRQKIVFLVLTLFVFLVFVPSVYAEGEVSLTDFPQQLADKLGIDLFPAQLLTSAIFLGLFLFPAILLAGKDNAIFAMVIVGLPVMGFCIAMEWLSYWFLLVVAMLIALMFSGKMRDWISGRM